MRLRLNEVTLEEARQAEHSERDHPLGRAACVLSFAPKCLGGFPRQGVLATRVAAGPLCEISDEPLGGIFRARGQLADPGEGRLCFLRSVALII
jgi:hypothetical protein